MNRLVGFGMIAALLVGVPMPIIAESVQAQTVQDRKEEADRQLKQGIQLVQTSRYREAIQAWEKALKIYREIQDRNGEANSIGNLGLAYNSLGQYQKAIEYYQQSLVIQKQIGNRNGEAGSINNLGLVYNNLGQYQKAIDFYQQSLAIQKQIGDHMGEAGSIVGLGNTYISLGQYQKAIEYFLQSLAIQKQIGDRKGEANSIVGLGNAYISLGQYQKAIEYYQQSLAIYKQIGDHKGEANLLVTLSFAYEVLGQYQKGIDFSLQSLAIFKQIADLRGEGNSLIGLSAAYIRLGQYQKAIDFSLQSLELFRQIGNREGEGDSLLSIGRAYYHLGDYQKAIEYYQQSLTIFKQIGNYSGEGALFANLGLVYNKLGQYQKSIEFHQQALTVLKQFIEYPAKGRSLIGMGDAYRNLGHYQKAIDFYQQSLSIFKQIRDLDGEGYALIGIGDAYKSLNQYQRSLDYYQKSLVILKQIGNREGEGLSLSNFGVVFTKLNQPELAILFYKQSVNVRESIRKDIRGLNKEEQEIFLSTVEKTYRNLADLLLKQDRILEAQQVLDLLKVQELSDYLKTVRGNSQTAQGVDLQRPEQNIIALAGELNQLQQKDREGKLNETEQQRLSQLVQAERDQNKQFNAFLDSPQIKKLITELRRNEDNQNVDIAKYRKLQKDLLSQFPNAVLLYPLILDDRLELVILNANIPPLRRTVNIKREQLNQLIIDLRTELQDSGSEDVKQTSQKLYDILIKPFENELSQLKINTIIYAPDGQLRYIPLASLYDGKQWLVEKYRVNNITAESLTVFNSKAISSPHIFAGAFGGKGSETRLGFNGLPASIPEVQKISSLFPNTTSLIEKDFTKKVTADRANSHTILHLATHGQLLVGTPEDSFIVFGNGERITIRELKDWSLQNVDLVVLSACQSGLGGNYGTGIEVLGLGYQMQSAGARVSISSLWKVDDVGTQALMTAFYGELQKGDVTVTEALRRAQIALIKSPQYNHPNYWSAFFAIGNGL